MTIQPGADEWITVEEATDERLASEVARRLRQAGVPVRLAEADPGDPSRQRGDAVVQVPLDRFDEALEALESLDEEEL
jgi:hypothetical protein